MPVRALLALTLALPAACGSSASPSGEASAETAGGDESEGSSEGRARRRRRRARDGEEFPLDEAALVPGTGVTLRAPRGSEPMPVGAGFIHRRRRMQILVIATEGPALLHESVRRGVSESATEEVETEDVEIDGEEAELHVDRQENGQLELERVWVYFRRGARSVLAVGAYAADRSERLRGLVRASLVTLSVDRETPIDPETALGFRLATTEGMAVDRSTSGNLTYGVPGAVPGETGYESPTLHVAPVPIDVPADARTAQCSTILEQIGPIQGDGADTRETISGDDLVGCEIVGHNAEPALATYAALLFRGDATFIVFGAVVEASRQPWIERFRAAARSVQPLRAAPAPAATEEETTEG